MSRFLPNVIVSNTLNRIQDSRFKIQDSVKQLEKELPKMVSKGLQQLYKYQQEDGGWGWWENDKSDPFMTAYVVYGLSQAVQAGYDVSLPVLERGREALLKHLASTSDPTTRVYMLYVLSHPISGKTIAPRMVERFYNDKSTRKINDYARSLLALAANNLNLKPIASVLASELEKNAIWQGGRMAKSGERRVSSIVGTVGTTSEASNAHWGGVAWHYEWQNDTIETTAHALKALVNIKPENRLLIESALRWLVSQRRGNAWRATKDTAMVIYALTDYLLASDELSPRYNLKLYLNGKIIKELKMTKNEVYKAPEEIVVNGNFLVPGENELRIEKKGEGKLYYSAVASYYPFAEDIAPSSAFSPPPFNMDKKPVLGFFVEREYFKLNRGKGKNKVHIPQPVSGIIQSGDELLVKLTVNADGDYDYFMLEDMLPAGCEVIQSDRGYNIPGYQQPFDEGFWGYWYAARERRDEKISLFVTKLSKGKHIITYLLRAQIPGNYHVMPAKASLMYVPELRASSAEGRIVIEE